MVMSTYAVSDSEAEARAALAAALRQFAAAQPNGLSLPDDHGLTPTVALQLCDELLRAVNLEVFELALWQSWGGAWVEPGPGRTER